MAHRLHPQLEPLGRGRCHLAIGETVILLHPLLPLVGVSIGMESERQQNDSLADGWCHPPADWSWRRVARRPASRSGPAPGFDGQPKRRWNGGATKSSSSRTSCARRPAHSGGPQHALVCTWGSISRGGEPAIGTDRAERGRSQRRWLGRRSGGSPGWSAKCYESRPTGLAAASLGPRLSECRGSGRSGSRNSSSRKSEPARAR